VDSSSLVGLAAGRLGKHLTTCTVEFEEEDSNEETLREGGCAALSGAD